MHSSISSFIKTHNLNEALVDGQPRRFNGIDHDDEQWQYGKGFHFWPNYDNAHRVCVAWGPDKLYLKPDEESKIVYEWVELVEAGLSLEDERLLKGSTMYPWTISAGLISRKVFDQEQVIERTDDGYNWQYTCRTCSPICWSLSDSLVSVLLSAEHDAGYFHGKFEI